MEANLGECMLIPEGYKYVKLLGKGGYGIVYLYSLDNQNYAVKFDNKRGYMQNCLLLNEALIMK